MFTIKITYETGDSFNVYTEEKIIGMCWNDINKAKEALIAIKEHTNFFNNRLNKDISSKSYWYSKYEDHDMSEYSILLKDDNNKLIKVSAFWRGYFERIKKANIVTDDEESEIIFYH